MVVAYATDPSTSVTTTYITPLHHAPTETPECVDTIAVSDAHSAPCKTKNIIAHGKVQQAQETTTDNQHTLVGAVHYYPKINRE